MPVSCRDGPDAQLASEVKMMELVASSAMALPASATPTPSAVAANNAANDAAVAAGSQVLSALAQQGGARAAWAACWAG